MRHRQPFISHVGYGGGSYPLPLSLRSKAPVCSFHTMGRTYPGNVQLPRPCSPGRSRQLQICFLCQVLPCSSPADHGEVWSCLIMFDHVWSSMVVEWELEAIGRLDSEKLWWYFRLAHWSGQTNHESWSGNVDIFADDPLSWASFEVRLLWGRHTLPKNWIPRDSKACVYIYRYIWTEREGERERERDFPNASDSGPPVSYHGGLTTVSVYLYPTLISAPHKVIITDQHESITPT